MAGWRFKQHRRHFSADFLKLKSGQLYNGGIDAGLTEDIEGKSIPYQGNYPIGAHVGILIRRNRIIGPF